MTTEMTDVLIAICRRVLESNRVKLDRDPNIRGVELTIRLSEKHQVPRTALLNVLQETKLTTTEFSMKSETYKFPYEATSIK